MSKYMESDEVIGYLYHQNPMFFLIGSAHFKPFSICPRLWTSAEYLNG